MIAAFFLLFCFNTSAQSFAEIRVGKKPLKAEIAADEETRRKGLMHRTSLAKNSGMLFVFENEQQLSFWMKNTYIPLSIGFFDNEMRLLEIRQMNPPASLMVKKPESCTSRQPARYALEVPKGWFKENGVNLGSKICCRGKPETVPWAGGRCAQCPE